MEGSRERIPMPRKWESGHFVLGQREGGMEVIGVATRHHARWGDEVLEQEIEAARDDAAQRVAMFLGMSGTVESFHRVGASFFDFVADSRIELERDAPDHTPFAERLTFDPARDVLVFERGMLVRFRYPASVPRVPSGRVSVGGRPEWVSGRDLPDVDGHILAVGFSQNQVWLRDTVARATEAAAAALLRSMYTTIEVADVDMQGGAVSEIRSVSQGRLESFAILEFWIDPATMSVYTLGIARAGI